MTFRPTDIKVPENARERNLLEWFRATFKAIQDTSITCQITFHADPNRDDGVTIVFKDDLSGVVLGQIMMASAHALSLLPEIIGKDPCLLNSASSTKDFRPE